MTKRSLLLILFCISLALFVITCGKKAAPIPPVPIVPYAVQVSKVVQSGNLLIYSFQLPVLNTDNRTPADINKIEIYRLKDLRIIPEPQTQTAPTQTQTQQSQTQTAPQTQSQPQPQTQTQTGPQTQSRPQTQSQTQPAPAKEEMPRVINEEELHDRSEMVAEIPKEMIDAYLKDGFFFYTEKINLAPESEDLKNWYYYAVKSYNKKGKSAGYSRTAALFPAIVPQPPSSFTAILSEKGIRLTWSAPKQDVTGKPLQESSITYNLYRGTNANFAPDPPLNGLQPLSTNGFTDTTFQFGQPYYYFVRAHMTGTKKEQESEASNAILIWPQDTFPPAAPQELNAVSAREGMVLIWAPNAENDVAGYNIYRSTESGTGYQKINSEHIRETTYTDKDVQAGQKYYYQITAVDSAPNPNESARSGEISEVKRQQ